MSVVSSAGFEWALQQMRAGNKVARQGWNGKGMYLVLMPGYPPPNGIPINQATATASGLPLGSVGFFSPYILIKTASLESPTFVPWVCSQEDLLGTDWVAG